MLELDGLSKWYGETRALDGLSFAVAPGQVFGFVGPNGAGKTTAMRIAIGVLAADGGEVRWDGQALDAEARRRIGYMPEERGLYPKMRVGEQLTYLAELHGVERPAAERSAGRWMERLGIADRADDRIEQLSLGNQQRAQLGASLVHEPDLLILDEPFSGLDPVGVDMLGEVLLGEARERDVPVVSPPPPLAGVERLCDAVAIVSAGAVVASGEVAELRARGAGRCWRVEVSGADDDWAREVEGARAIGDHVYRLEEQADPQRLLDVARSAGSVIRFGPEAPTLAELFRDAVAREDAGPAAERTAPRTEGGGR